MKATEKALRVVDKDHQLVTKGSAKSGAEYFAAHRSYHGLDIQSNNSLPEPFLIGRTGKASGYEDEKKQAGEFQWVCQCQGKTGDKPDNRNRILGNGEQFELEVDQRVSDDSNGQGILHSPHNFVTIWCFYLNLGGQVQRYNYNLILLPVLVFIPLQQEWINFAPYSSFRMIVRMLDWCAKPIMYVPLRYNCVCIYVRNLL